MGDLLLQVVFHCQLAQERRAFNFEKVARHITDKLIRRHPHVFGEAKVRTVDAVWTQWEQIKKAEKQGTKHHRPSALDGIPRYLPALLRAEKLIKKARKAKLMAEKRRVRLSLSKADIARQIFDLAEYAQGKGWSSEELLRTETKKRERRLRKLERSLGGGTSLSIYTGSRK